jgi:hypothetical protein
MSRSRWTVRSVRRTGRAGSLLSSLPIFGPPQSRIEQDLEPMAPFSIDDVRRRAHAASHAINYLGRLISPENQCRRGAAMAAAG